MWTCCGFVVQHFVQQIDNKSKRVEFGPHSAWMIQWRTQFVLLLSDNACVAAMFYVDGGAWFDVNRPNTAEHDVVNKQKEEQEPK